MHAFIILSGHTGRILFAAAEIGWTALLSVLLSTLLSTPLIFVHLSTLLSTVLVRGCRAVILLCILLCIRCLLRSAWHIGLFSAKIGAALHAACVEGWLAAV